MARNHRVWFPNAKYHVTSRGNRKETLFYEPQDYFKFLTILKETKDKYPFIIQSYCLMTNHYHLQINTQQYNISYIMQIINSNYARYHNKKYELTGHVFQGRCNPELILFPDYELEVNRYIHLNPLKANIVTNLNDYPWSSYHAYAHNKPDPLIDDTSQFLTLFPHPQQKNYNEFLLSKRKSYEIILHPPKTNQNSNQTVLEKGGYEDHGINHL